MTLTRGAARAAMRRMRPCAPAWVAANAQSLPFRMKKVNAYIEAYKASLVKGSK